MNELVKQKYGSAGRITISPYVDKKKSNMGLEKYDMVLFPNTAQNETMACIEEHGTVRYLNGLDETAPEVKLLPEEKRNARIKEIRSIVAMLEFQMHYNELNIEDPQFWSKVITHKPNNIDFWSKISIICTNNTIALDPINKTEDLLKVLSIEAGGFPMIAKSREDCESGVNARKWFLDRQLETASVKASTAKIKNKALAILQSLSEEKPRKLFYIAKMLSTASIQFKNSTLPDQVYDFVDSYINGMENESVIKNAAQNFMELSKLDMKELKIRAMIKDATFFKIIILKGDGLQYLAKDNIMVGRNPSEVYEYMVNPMNENILQIFQERVEQTWN